jgi:hypothetical protein
MANPGEPTISLGATGDAVKRLSARCGGTPDLGLTVDGVFGPKVETAIKQFQQDAGLTVDGIVGPVTWAALPDGGPMPTLQEGSTGSVVNSLQTLLTNGAPGQRNIKPQGIDGNFGPHAKASVVAFQAWGRVARDGVVGDQTWAVSLRAASATLEQRSACSSLSVHPTLRTRFEASAARRTPLQPPLVLRGSKMIRVSITVDARNVIAKRLPKGSNACRSEPDWRRQTLAWPQVRVRAVMAQYRASRHCHSSPSIGAFWAISVRLLDPQIIDFAHLSPLTPGALDK